MHVIVLVTCPNMKSAGKISDILLEKRLAACTNTIPGIESRFRWKGKVKKSKEALMIIKTTKALVKKVEKAVKENHSYEVPEIIAIPIVSGSNEYLNWINSETKE
jgi:periplasmic divalent cation tolerance protein